MLAMACVLETDSSSSDSPSPCQPEEVIAVVPRTSAAMPEAQECGGVS